MSLPLKRSVAVLIRNEGRILSVRRPENDDELPGVWGLPAGTYREGESLEDLVRRIGRDKLRVQLVPVRMLGQGTQARERYRLAMELWEVAMQGEPHHAAWQWTSLEILELGKAQGSLCCRLALESERVN